MPSESIKPITFPAELEARTTPAVRAFGGVLLDRIAKLKARVEELERGRGSVALRHRYHRNIRHRAGSSPRRRGL